MFSYPFQARGWTTYQDIYIWQHLETFWKKVSSRSELWALCAYRGQEKFWRPGLMFGGAEIYSIWDQNPIWKPDLPGSYLATGSPHIPEGA